MSGAAIRIDAPAKLNLGLRVTGVRGDGYHLLESLFVPLDLCDELELAVEPAPEAAVELRVEGGPPGLENDARNLAVRAATGFLAAAGVAARVRIRLAKRIAVGAGLGGGSSDAGAVLRALARRFPGALSPPELAALALSLGADVPYFLDPRPAFVRGIGERIDAVAGLPSLPVLVATPSPGLATAAVFAAWDRVRASRTGTDSAALTPGEGNRRMPALPVLLAELSKELDPSADRWQTLLAQLLVNDLEPVAVGLAPAVGRLRTEIERAGARAVGMSGSGPTVFGVFEDLGEAQSAAAGIAWQPGDRVHVGRTAGSP